MVLTFRQQEKYLFTEMKKNKLIEIYTSVTGIKLILFAICSLFLSLLFLFDEIRNYYYIYVSFYLMVLGQIFFPVWFFQGIENGIYYIN